MADPAELFNTVQTILDPIVTKLLLALILLLIGFVIGRVIGKVLQKVLKEVEFDLLLKKTTGLEYKFTEILSKLASYLIYFIFIIMAMDRLGIQTIAFNIILGGFILLIFIMILLGIKDFIPNLIAGFFLHKKKFVQEGDKVKIGDIEGKIVNISTIETKIKTKKGDELYVPNSFLTKNEVLKLKK
tara:strand:+ start:157 stop:714 length:558 start_codon:yes stop_codon:yes gene_type:complete